AIGGVVNVISDDIPLEIPVAVEGRVGAQSESAFPGAAVSARAAIPLNQRWVVTARTSARTSAEMRIPRDPRLGDRLANTDARSIGASLGFARHGDAGGGGMAFRTYRFAYGLPVAPGTAAVGLEGQRNELSGTMQWTPRTPLLSAVRIDAAVQDYGHDEVDEEAGERLQRFGLRTGTASLVL